MDLITIYRAKDVYKVKKGDKVKIARIISSYTFLKILRRHPNKIEISRSALNQMKRISTIIDGIRIYQKTPTKIEIIKK